MSAQRKSRAAQAQPVEPHLSHMASLDSLSDELLADVLSYVPQKQTLTSLPCVCRYLSAAGSTGV